LALGGALGPLNAPHGRFDELGGGRRGHSLDAVGLRYGCKTSDQCGSAKRLCMNGQVARDHLRGRRESYRRKLVTAGIGKAAYRGGA
jgi:hypothetical protein